MRLVRFISIFFILLFVLVPMSSVARDNMVNFTEGGYLLNSRDKVSVYVDPNAPVAVRVAAENLCHDIEEVSGTKAMMVNKAKNAEIRIKVAPDDKKWETYTISVDKKGIDLRFGDIALQGKYPFCDAQRPYHGQEDCSWVCH